MEASRAALCRANVSEAGGSVASQHCRGVDHQLDPVLRHSDDMHPPAGHARGYVVADSAADPCNFLRGVCVNGASNVTCDHSWRRPDARFPLRPGGSRAFAAGNLAHLSVYRDPGTQYILLFH